VKPRAGWGTRGDGPADPEIVNVDGKTGIKVYLCAPCAGVLRAKQAAGHPMGSIDLRWLCGACRCSARRGQEKADAS
jgi:hypothetical protein